MPTFPLGMIDMLITWNELHTQEKFVLDNGACEYVKSGMVKQLDRMRQQKSRKVA
jgi:hypothetical protein